MPQTFFILYQICLWIFLLQGFGLPLFVIASFTICLRQEKRLQNLKRMADTLAGKSTDSPNSKAGKRKKIEHRSAASLLKSLPKLQPLNCIACGAGVILEETRSRCPNCQSTAALPDDYAMAASLRSRVRKLVRRAVWQWRSAKFLSSRFLARLFFLAIFLEPLGLLTTVIIGSSEFRETWLDRLGESLGHGQVIVNVLIYAGFVGVFVGMFMLIFLSGWGAGVRKKLPVAPVLANERHVRETANCQACGGCIEYDTREFATICGYCHVENYRVQFAHWERSRGESAKADATFTLFAALEIVNDLFFTFWMIGGIFYFLFLLLTIGCGIKVWLSI